MVTRTLPAVVAQAMKFVFLCEGSVASSASKAVSVLEFAMLGDCSQQDVHRIGIQTHVCRLLDSCRPTC